MYVEAGTPPAVCRGSNELSCSSALAFCGLSAGMLAGNITSIIVIPACILVEAVSSCVEQAPAVSTLQQPFLCSPVFRALSSRHASAAMQDYVSLNTIADKPGATHYVRCSQCVSIRRMPLSQGNAQFALHAEMLTPKASCRQIQQALTGCLVTLLQRKRLGRGIGSGLGKTSGRGHKGQNARTGARTALAWGLLSWVSAAPLCCTQVAASHCPVLLGLL